MIYLDNGATSLIKPQTVIDAVVNAMTHMGNAGRGSSESAMTATRIIYQCRIELTDLINGQDPHQLVFTHNATESLNTVIQGLFEPGDHVITSVMEHNSVLRPLYLQEQKGVELTFLPINEMGVISPADVEAAIRDNTKAMVFTHASNVTGNINPVKEVTQILHQHNILAVLDASQTMGAIPVDIQELGVDILCFTGHKSLLGPQGTGGIYIKPGIEIRPLKSGGSGINTFDHFHPKEFPTALEAGTLNGHGIAGLLAGVTYIKEKGVANIRDHERALLDYFYDQVQQIPQIKVYGSFQKGIDRCGILSINIGDLDSAIVVEELIDRGEIMTRGGGHCAPLMHQALGTAEQGVVRFSLSHLTSKEEIDQSVNCLKAIQADLCDV